MVIAKKWLRFSVFLGVLIVAHPDKLAQADNLVGLIKLIATPEKYDGKNVEAIGFLKLEYEGDKLYLHEEDYKHGITENAIWLGVTKKQRQDLENSNMHYALVAGTFKAGNNQMSGHTNGTIIHITVARIWPFDRSSE